MSRNAHAAWGTCAGIFEEEALNSGFLANFGPSEAMYVVSVLVSGTSLRK